MDTPRGGYSRALFPGHSEIWNEGFCGRRRKALCERMRTNNKLTLLKTGEELNPVHSSGR